MNYFTSIYKWKMTSTEGKSKHPFSTPVLNWSVFFLAKLLSLWLVWSTGKTCFRPRGEYLMTVVKLSWGFLFFFSLLPAPL